MIGHFVGVGAQFIAESVCKLTLDQANICPIAGVFIHEFIVEPLVNSMLMNENYEQDGYNIKRLIAGAIGAVIFSQAIEHFVEEDGHITMSSAASLVGSIAGGNIYDLL